MKQTLYFGNPAYLSMRNSQLVIKMPEVENVKGISDEMKQSSVATKPIEDIGVLIIDHKQITLTSALISALLDNNCAVVTCNAQSLPTGLLLPLSGNTTQAERFTRQIQASLPLKKQLWAQTVKRKILNQAAVLSNFTDAETACMKVWAEKVRSGDPDNLEARAAAYYWKVLFPHIPDFTRDREGVPPNNLLNYGYAILRAIVARSLVASGLLPTLGIHHHNRYNAYCLADDIMEPYRPFVDALVLNTMQHHSDIQQLTKPIKYDLLSVAYLDTFIDGACRPLTNAVAQTTASLYKCFANEIRQIAYPDYESNE